MIAGACSHRESILSVQVPCADLGQISAPGGILLQNSFLAIFAMSAYSKSGRFSRLPANTGAGYCLKRMLPETEGRIVVLSDKQADDLLRAAIKDEDPYCLLFVLFGLNTAMRHREILRARFDHLDIENRRLYIPQAKAGDREQPITPQLAEILEQERAMRDDPEGWIFPSPRPNTSATGHRHRMDKPFRRAVIKAKLDPQKITPHVMRHTAITNLVQAGIDLPTIQRISGHRTLKMVLRYAHVHGRHIDQAIQAIGRGSPEPMANETPDTVTLKLHTQQKRPA